VDTAAATPHAVSLTNQGATGQIDTVSWSSNARSLSVTSKVADGTASSPEVFVHSLRSPDGSGPQTSVSGAGFTHRWSRDGRKFVAVSADEKTLYLAELAEAWQQRGFDLGGFRVWDMFFMPDARGVALLLGQGSDVGIFALDFSSAELIRLTSPELDFNPNFVTQSADGRLLAAYDTADNAASGLVVLELGMDVLAQHWLGKGRRLEGASFAPDSSAVLTTDAASQTYYRVKGSALDVLEELSTGTLAAKSVAWGPDAAHLTVATEHELFLIESDDPTHVNRLLSAQTQGPDAWRTDYLLSHFVLYDRYTLLDSALPEDQRKPQPVADGTAIPSRGWVLSVDLNRREVSLIDLHHDMSPVIIRQLAGAGGGRVAISP
jgi:hypothetical protein